MKYIQYSPVQKKPCAQKEKTEEEQKAPPICGCTGIYGLLHYRKWWERNEIDIAVCGKLITGTPIFIEENTLRVINSQYSYFIPLEKIDYIRTTDGLCSSFQLPD